MRYSRSYIASILDYAVLKPTATIDDIRAGAAFVNKHKIKSFCVASSNVEIAASICDRITAVIGFPHGNASADAKYYEAVAAVRDGATELDVVVGYGRYLGGNESIIAQDLKPIMMLAEREGVLVKAILESCYYSTPQLVEACVLCANLGVDYVKTSTGFGEGGATVGNVRTMYNAVTGTKTRVMASSLHSKNYAGVKTLLDLGIARIGASSLLELTE